MRFGVLVCLRFLHSPQANPHSKCFLSFLHAKRKTLPMLNSHQQIARHTKTASFLSLLRFREARLELLLWTHFFIFFFRILVSQSSEWKCEFYVWSTCFFSLLPLLPRLPSPDIASDNLRNTDAPKHRRLPSALAYISLSVNPFLDRFRVSQVSRRQLIASMVFNFNRPGRGCCCCMVKLVRSLLNTRSRDGTKKTLISSLSFSLDS